MPREIKVTCDTCGRDLTTTSNCEDFRLVVKSERIPSQGGIVTAMAAYPPTKREYVFCDLGCLRKHPLATGKPIEEVAE